MAFACASAQGRRPTMEDESVCGVEVGGEARVFAVLDGHGGCRAAQLVAREVPALLASLNGPDGWPGEAAAKAAVSELDARILASAASEQWDDGTCACIALVDGVRRRLHVVQVGDSNALLLRRDASGRLHTTTGHHRGLLCTSHRPTERSEAARLRAAGATVSADGRCAGLAVSRALGDFDAKRREPATFICEPQVLSHQLADEALLVIACDGLWDFVSAEACAAALDAALAPAPPTAEAHTAAAPPSIEVPSEPPSEYDAFLAALSAGPKARKARGIRPPPSVDAAAQALVALALDAGSDDNVSVVVVDLTGELRPQEQLT